MKKIGILVGGGPAPGINSVIAAAAIEAINSGFQPIGIKNGYEYLVKKDINHTINLEIEKNLMNLFAYSPKTLVNFLNF